MAASEGEQEPPATADEPTATAADEPTATAAEDARDGAVAGEDGLPDADVDMAHPPPPEPDAQKDDPCDAGLDVAHSASSRAEARADAQDDAAGGSGHTSDSDLDAADLGPPESTSKTLETDAQNETGIGGDPSSEIGDDVPPPPPPPPAASAGPTADAAAAGAAAAPPPDSFMDESRYIRGANDELLHKWKIDYAPRGGGGRAMCRDLQCLERHAQDGVRSIEKGDLRIGRRVLMQKDGADGEVVMMWYHARCMFSSFVRSRKTTRVISAAEDLENFENLQYEDQQMIRRFIDGSEDVRGAKSRAAGGAGRNAGLTPEKRSASFLDDGGGAAKKRNVEKESRELKKGDRVWTHCRVRPAATEPGVGNGMVFAVKSPKAELAIVREDVSDGTVILQFESEEHEKERIEKYCSGSKTTLKILGWLRYPRIFEGKKQKIPVNWIQWKRPPPKLCGCTKQSWNHSCECGISCGRGASKKVWGVGD